MKRAVMIGAGILLLASAAQAEQITCRGNITSIQGEGMVHQTHRFEVPAVTGNDIAAILEKCKEIALDRQNRAAKANPGGTFRKFSDVNLQCVKGGEAFPVRRYLQTAP